MGGAPMLPGFEAADYPEDLGGLNVAAYLDALITRVGSNRAAADLGVSYHTVRKWRSTGVISKVLQAAVEKRLAASQASPKPAQAPGDAIEPPKLREIQEALSEAGAKLTALKAAQGELEARLAALETAASKLGSNAAAVDDALSRLGSRLDRLESRGGDADRLAGAPQTSAVAWTHRGAYSEAHGGRDGDTDALVERWSNHRTAASQARTKLDRAQALLGQREAEIELIERGESLPPGEYWGHWRRVREVEWRRSAVFHLQSEIRWRLFRRRIRRFASLGLWRD